MAFNEKAFKLGVHPKQSAALTPFLPSILKMPSHWSKQRDVRQRSSIRSMVEETSNIAAPVKSNSYMCRLSSRSSGCPGAKSPLLAASCLMFRRLKNKDFKPSADISFSQLALHIQSRGLLPDPSLRFRSVFQFLNRNPMITLKVYFGHPM